MPKGIIVPAFLMNSLSFLSRGKDGTRGPDMIYQDVTDTSVPLEFDPVVYGPAWWCGYFWMAYLSGLLGTFTWLWFG